MTDTTTFVSELFEVGEPLFEACDRAINDHEAMEQLSEDPSVGVVLSAAVSRMATVIDTINSICEKETIAFLSDEEIDRTFDYFNLVVNTMRVLIPSESSWKDFVKSTASREVLGAPYIEWKDYVDTDFMIEYNALMES